MHAWYKLLSVFFSATMTLLCSIVYFRAQTSTVSKGRRKRSQRHTFPNFLQIRASLAGMTTTSFFASARLGSVIVAFYSHAVRQELQGVASCASVVLPALHLKLCS